MAKIESKKISKPTVEDTEIEDEEEDETPEEPLRKSKTVRVRTDKKSKDTKKKDQTETKNTRGLKEETKQGIFVVIFFVIALITTLSAFHGAGSVGQKIFDILSYLFGVGYYLLPIMFFMLGISFLKVEKRHLNFLKSSGAVVFLLSSLGVISLIAREMNSGFDGGKVGWLVATPMNSLFAFWASLIVLSAALVISCLVLFETTLTVDTIFFWRRWKKDEEEDDFEIIGDQVEDELEEEKEIDKPAEEVKEPEKDSKTKKKEKDIIGLEPDEEMNVSKNTPLLASIPYIPPPLTLLEKDKGKPGVGDIKANANIIKRTLQNFGIDVEMDEISIGPSITRYALKPAEGVKLSRIVALQNDLSLALAAHPLRIEAPIPGKSLVGIEIPNTAKTTVGMATLLSAEEYQISEKPLLLAMGKGISGKSHFANLAKMPHCLIAGTTGSGKSVTIHTIINSLLFRNSPETLKFIMIDPKRVELTLYNKIPHLLTPVITDAKKTILALKWAAKEMDRRYDILEAEACKDIDSYHKNILKPETERIAKLQDKGTFDPNRDKVPETMPYIVIIIDELADIMMTYPRELEAGIVRLAQMSRAVGIHLIVSTQRPSVNVITGLIKANIPSRVALQVASQIDSRTILDAPGAEKLLGAGDMLYLGGEMSKPIRVQSAYISENEVKAVVKYLVDHYRDEVPTGIDLETAAQGANNTIFSAMMDEGEPGDEDDLYEQAKDEVIKVGKASTSYIQRKLRVGYSRAARLMDMLEERGVIGPSDGSKAREVINGGGPVANQEVESIDEAEEAGGMDEEVDEIKDIDTEGSESNGKYL